METPLIFESQKTNQIDAQGRQHGLWEYRSREGRLWCRKHYHYGELKGIEKWWNPQETLTFKKYILVIK
jgi:hypothetical protein